MNKVIQTATLADPEGGVCFEVTHTRMSAERYSKLAQATCHYFAGRDFVTVKEIPAVSQAATTRRGYLTPRDAVDCFKTIAKDLLAAGYVVAAQ